MNGLTLRLLESTVVALGILAVALAVLVFLLMDIRYRRQLARSARRMILTSKFLPFPKPEGLRALWSGSGTRDREIIEEIVANLCRLGKNSIDRTVEEAVIEAGIFDRWVQDLENGRAGRRVTAAIRVGYVHCVRAVDALNRACEDSSPEVRLAGLLGLGWQKDPRGLPGLMKIADGPPGDIPDLTLAAALAECADGSPGKLENFLKGPEVRRRLLGAWALSDIADRTVLPGLLDASLDSEAEVRAKVAGALARIADPESAKALVRLAQDPVWFVRIRALDALGRLRESSGWPAALLGLEDEVREVRYRAAFALRQIGGMKGDVATKVLVASSRPSFDDLISEWERAGFLWWVVGALSVRDWPQFIESRDLVRALIGAGVTRTLIDFLLVYPDIKVRLRLLQLVIGASGAGARADLLEIARQPRCDHRVAAAIRRAFPDAPSVPATPVGEVTA
jgi:hypothetical protein